jgi:hypothetical protein
MPLRQQRPDLRARLLRSLMCKTAKVGGVLELHEVTGAKH